MTWNYRIVHHSKTDEDGVELADSVKYFAVHEVFYNDNGEPHSRTKYPDRPTGESPEEVIEMLEQMLADCKAAPLLVEPFEWAKTDEPEGPWIELTDKDFEV